MNAVKKNRPCLSARRLTRGVRPVGAVRRRAGVPASDAFAKRGDWLEGGVMAVPKYRRETAEAEFVRTAAKLEALTGRMCARLPKRWSFTRTRYITDCANDILDHAVRANALWVRTVDDAAERMWHLNEAYAACYTLLRKIDVIEEEMPVRVIDERDPDGSVRKTEKACLSPGLLQQWTILATSELKLLKGVIRSDRRRFGTKLRTSLVRQRRSKKAPSSPTRAAHRRISHRHS